MFYILSRKRCGRILVLYTVGEGGTVWMNHNGINKRRNKYICYMCVLKGQCGRGKTDVVSGATGMLHLDWEESE